MYIFYYVYVTISLIIITVVPDRLYTRNASRNRRYITKSDKENIRRAALYSSEGRKWRTNKAATKKI